MLRVIGQYGDREISKLGFLPPNNQKGKTMKAIQYYGPQNIKYEEVMVKPPEEGEVVVKVMSALTCGTDVKTFRRGHPVLIKSVPSGFGHEFAGIVYMA